MFCRKFDFGLFAFLLITSLLLVMLSPQARGSVPIHHTDATREHAYVVDMKTDWRTIFPRVRCCVGPKSNRAGRRRAA